MRSWDPRFEGAHAVISGEMKKPLGGASGLENGLLAGRTSSCL